MKYIDFVYLAILRHGNVRVVYYSSDIKMTHMKDSYEDQCWHRTEQRLVPPRNFSFIHSTQNQVGELVVFEVNVPCCEGTVSIIDIAIISPELYFYRPKKSRIFTHAKRFNQNQQSRRHALYYPMDSYYISSLPEKTVRIMDTKQ